MGGGPRLQKGFFFLTAILFFPTDACVSFNGEAAATAGTANALSVRGLRA